MTHGDHRETWGSIVNTAALEGVPCFSRDGHWMFFNSDRPGGFGSVDIWASYRAHIHDDFGWEAPVNLGAGVNTAAVDNAPSFLENDEGGPPLLFYGSNRPGGLGAIDIYVSAMGANGSFGPGTLVPELSSPQKRPTARDTLRRTGDFFFSNRPGSAGIDLWTSRRETVFDTWSPLTNLGPVVSSGATEQQPAVSSDRESLFFSSDRAGGYGGPDLWVTTRGRINEQ